MDGARNILASLAGPLLGRIGDAGAVGRGCRLRRRGALGGLRWLSAGGGLELRLGAGGALLDADCGAERGRRVNDATAHPLGVDLPP